MRKSKMLLAFLAVAILVTGLSSYGSEASADTSSSDKLWEWVVYPRYELVNPFVNGFALVSYGELAVLPNGEVMDFPLKGLIDREGNLVVPMEYHWFGVVDGVLQASKTVAAEEGDAEGQISWLPDGTTLITKTWTVGADGSLTIYHPDENRFDWTWEVFIPNSFFDFNERNVKDRTTNEVLIPAYDIIRPFSRGFAAVLGEGGWGLIDAENNIIIPLEYEFIDSFIDDQLLSAEETPTWEQFSGNSVTRKIQRGGKWGLINDRGEFVVELIYDHGYYNGWPTGIAEFHNGIAPVSQNGRWGAIDTMGNIVVPIEYAACSTSSGLAAVRNDDGLYGAFDKTGRLVVPFEYEEIHGFDSDLIAVRKNGKTGYVNMDGELVIENTFDSAYGFFGDLARVSRNGKWGFINKNGEVVLPLVYDGVWGITEGIAAVQVGTKWGFARPAPEQAETQAALVNADMDDSRFVNLQIDNPLANSSAVLTHIDAGNNDVVPVVERGRTLVPLRFVSENLDSEVEWSGAEQKVVVKSGDTTIELFVGRTQAYINGEAVHSDVAPVIRNGRTLIPLRFVGEVMGYRVDWREDDRVVEIHQAP